jgi:hypothetical protein
MIPRSFLGRADHRVFIDMPASMRGRTKVVEGVIMHIDFENYDGTIVPGDSKERRRFLESCGSSLSPALKEELENLRNADDASSVSTVSLNTYPMPEELLRFMFWFGAK